MMEAEDSQKHAERVAKLMSRVVEDPEYDTHSPEVLKAAGARYGVKTHIGMHIVSKSVEDLVNGSEKECCAIETLDTRQGTEGFGRPRT